jgi:hypothetical protein
MLAATEDLGVRDAHAIFPRVMLTRVREVIEGPMGPKDRLETLHLKTPEWSISRRRRNLTQARSDKGTLA